MRKKVIKNEDEGLKILVTVAGKRNVIIFGS